MVGPLLLQGEGPYTLPAFAGYNVASIGSSLETGKVLMALGVKGVLQIEASHDTENNNSTNT